MAAPLTVDELFARNRYAPSGVTASLDLICHSAFVKDYQRIPTFRELIAAGRRLPNILISEYPSTQVLILDD